MRKSIYIFFILVLLSQGVVGAETSSKEQSTQDADGKSFLEKYPHLIPNVYVEPDSNIYLGFSLGMLGILSNRMIFSANFFQIHYISDTWDSELLSISYATTTANPGYVQSKHFIFRSIPKYHINKTVSVGPLIGYEYVSFPQISVVLYDSGYQTKPEPFSSSGLIYGLGISENFDMNKHYKMKINQLVYQQTYSTQSAGRGWSYLYELSTLRTDATPIKAGVVFLLELGIIF